MVSNIIIQHFYQSIVHAVFFDSESDNKSDIPLLEEPNVLYETDTNDTEQVIDQQEDEGQYYF